MVRIKVPSVAAMYAQRVGHGLQLQESYTRKRRSGTMKQESKTETKKRDKKSKTKAEQNVPTGEQKGHRMVIEQAPSGNVTVV
jgi:stringent starvation protein B